MLIMRNVVSLWDENKVLGTVNGLTFYNNNGAIRKFMTQSQLDNFLTSYGAIIK